MYGVFECDFEVASACHGGSVHWILKEIECHDILKCCAGSVCFDPRFGISIVDDVPFGLSRFVISLDDDSVVLCVVGCIGNVSPLDAFEVDHLVVIVLWHDISGRR